MYDFLLLEMFDDFYPLWIGKKNFEIKSWESDLYWTKKIAPIFSFRVGVNYVDI